VGDVRLDGDGASGLVGSFDGAIGESNGIATNFRTGLPMSAIFVSILHSYDPSIAPGCTT
jgi:hypothetical protein